MMKRGEAIFVICAFTMVFLSSVNPAISHAATETQKPTAIFNDLTYCAQIQQAVGGYARSADF